MMPGKFVFLFMVENPPDFKDGAHLRCQILTSLLTNLGPVPLGGW